jgi:hypothetical protein
MRIAAPLLSLCLLAALIMYSQRQAERAAERRQAQGSSPAPVPENPTPAETRNEPAAKVPPTQHGGEVTQEQVDRYIKTGLRDPLPDATDPFVPPPKREPAGHSGPLSTAGNLRSEDRPGPAGPVAKPGEAARIREAKLETPRNASRSAPKSKARATAQLARPKTVNPRAPLIGVEPPPRQETPLTSGSLPAKAGAQPTDGS